MLKHILGSIKSLRGKFLAIILPPVVLSFVLFSTLLSVLASRDGYNELADRMDTFAQVQATTIARTLWELNYDAIEKQLEGFLIYPDILSVKVSDSAGFISASRSRVGIGQLKDDESGSVVRTIAYDTPKGRKVIGTLVVTYDKRPIGQEQLDNLLRDSLLLLCLITVFVFSVILAHRKTIGVPLEKFHGAITQARRGERLAVNWTSEDELGQVITAYNRLVEKLAGKEASLAQVILELGEAKKGAEAASRAKSDFLASMSHEIRTPLNSIVAMSSMLLSTRQTDEQHQYAHVCSLASQSLINIVNDILSFSRIESGKETQADFASFDLRSRLEEVIEIVAVAAHDKGLELVILFDEGVPDKALGDAPKLRQVLMNLVGNAIKFTEKGKIVVRVLAYPVKGVTFDLQISVSDTGIGIPEEDQENIFTQFTQADSSSSKKYEGSGLGLTISRHFVELMGGEIEVESAQGGGSTFTFTVELGSSGDARTRITPLFADKKILCVDDHSENCELVFDVLHRYGADVVSAASLEEARMLQIKDPQKFSLILLDLEMGGEPIGMDAAPELSGNGAAPVVLMVPTNTPRPDRELARLHNITAYLPKPLIESVLLAAVENAFSGQSSIQSDSLVKISDVRIALPAMKVLLVEDSEFNQFVVQSYLKDTAVELEFARNGLEAVEKFRTGDYDVILMDIQMPVMDGFAATAEIRSLEHEEGRIRIPIIAMTAYVLQEEVEKCLQSGCDDHLSKPVSRKELFSMLLSRYRSSKRMPALDSQESFSASAVVEVEPIVESDFNTAVGGTLQAECIEEPVLCYEAVSEPIFVSIDPDFRHIAGQFVRFVYDSVSSMEKALEKKDLDTVRMLGHRMKGEGGALGFAPVSDLGKYLQDSAVSGDMITLSKALISLKNYISRVVIK
jgi:signal transduction histidine kinase/DNA-binding response OmpR family regulator/HPt (histidine-containing phosphotransfer) domain-containing protein